MVFFFLMIFVAFTLVQPGANNAFIASLRPLRIVGGIAFVVWLLQVLKGRDLSQFKTTQSLLLLSLAGMQLISSMQLMWIPYTLKVAQDWVRQLVVYFLLSTVVISVDRARKLLWICVLGASFLVGWGLNVYYADPNVVVEKILAQRFQTEGIDPETIRPDRLQEYREQLMGVVGDRRLFSYGSYDGANDLALVLVLLWPIAFKLMEMERPGPKKLLLALLIPFFTYAVILTGSRGGLLGMSVVAALSIFTARSLAPPLKLIAVGVMAFVIVGVGVARVQERKDVTGFFNWDKPVRERFDAMYAARLMIADYPLLGVGPDQYREYVASYGGQRGIATHNTLLKVGAETGILGMFLYAGIFLVTARELLRLMKRFKRDKANRQIYFLSQALFISLVGFAFNTLFSVKENEWFLYIILGLSAAVVRMAAKAVKDAKGTPPALQPAT